MSTYRHRKTFKLGGNDYENWHCQGIIGIFLLVGLFHSQAMDNSQHAIVLGQELQQEVKDVLLEQ